MKKKFLLLICTVAVCSLTACGGNNKPKTTAVSTIDPEMTKPEKVYSDLKNYKELLDIDGIYTCKDGFTKNATKDSMNTELLVFASIKPTATQPEKIYASIESSDINGNLLNLVLETGKDKNYLTIYEKNDHHNALSRNWRFYKSGLRMDPIMTVSKDDKQVNRIVGLFSIPTKEYKTLVKKNATLTLKWDSLTGKAKAKTIKNKSSIDEISKEARVMMKK